MPREPDRGRLVDLVAGDDDAVPVDHGRGLNEIVPGGDLERRERPAVAGLEPRADVVEEHANPAPLDLHRLEERAEVHDVLAVVLGERPEGQALADVLLVAGMDVIRAADVGQDGHARVGDAHGGRLRLPEQGEDVGAGAVAERRNLRPVEREFLLAPDLAPALDERPRLVVVEHPFGHVRLALVPDGAAGGERDDGVDHRVVHAGRRRPARKRMAAGQGKAGRRRRQEVIVLRRLSRGPQPGVGLLARIVRGRRLDLPEVGELARADLVRDIRHLVDAREAGRRRPRLDTGPAPRRRDESDGRLQLLVEMPPEEIEHGREVRHRLRRAGRPPRVHVPLRHAAQDVRHEEQANLRVLGLSDLPKAVGRGPHAPLHVRLARADPDLADQDVVQRKRVGSLDRHLVGAAGLHLGKLDLPLAALVGCRLLVVSRERHGDLLTRFRPAPDLHRHVLLEDHVASDHARQRHVGRRGRRKDRRQNQPDTAPSSHVHHFCTPHRW